jgi:acyl carrier protein
MNDSIPSSRAEVVDQLRAAFCKVTGQEPATAAWSESARLRDDLGLDSFAALELLFELEDRLGVRIARAAAMTFQTVGDVVTHVMAELAAPGAAERSPQEPVAP